MPEYHKRGSRNTTHMLFQNPENRRTFAASIRTNSMMTFRRTSECLSEGHQNVFQKNVFQRENINLISGRQFI